MLAGLAFVLSYAGATANTARDALRAADEVRRKAQRVAEELHAMHAAMMDTQRLLDEGHPPMPEHSASEVTSWAETIAESVDAFRKSKTRTEQAAQMLAKATKDAVPHGAMIERAFPGWKDASLKVEPALSQLREELAKVDLDEIAHSVTPHMGSLVAMAMAEQGFNEWTARLPHEEQALVDESDGQPIRWDLDSGWVSEVAR
jgi:hypothetical protein